jgi:hypothetical protein
MKNPRESSESRTESLLLILLFELTMIGEQDSIFLYESISYGAFPARTEALFV